MSMTLFGISTLNAQNMNTNQSLAQLQPLQLTSEWDKTFAKSEKVDHRKVTFVNRYGITLAADMYAPKNAKGKLPAVAVSGPFGAVKEQSSGLYAQQLAERGFLTIAFDPSFTGESGGMPLAAVSPAYYRKVMKYGLHRFARFARVVWEIPSDSLTEEQLAVKGIDALAAWIEEIGAATNISMLGADGNNIEKIADATLIFDAGYKELSRADVIEILKESL